jgi:hypothetical protein
MGELAGGLEYPAVHAAIARFQKRLKIDRELQQKLKKVAKTLRIEFDPVHRVPDPVHRVRKKRVLKV